MSEPVRVTEQDREAAIDTLLGVLEMCHTLPAKRAAVRNALGAARQAAEQERDRLNERLSFWLAECATERHQQIRDALAPDLVGGTDAWDAMSAKDIGAALRKKLDEHFTTALQIAHDANTKLQAAEQRAERWKREAMAHRAFYDFDDPDDDAGYQSVLVEREVSRAANEAAEREDAARREQSK